MTNLATPYADQLDRSCPLPEHPRPQLVRDSFFNLNGTWQYAITTDAKQPEEWPGDILVPFSPETLLSGVQHCLAPEEYLWYRRSFCLPAGFRKGRVLLHFGAVDQSCTVHVNGQQAGVHQGGFTPFSIDITELLNEAEEAEQELLVMATDPTDTSPMPRGRQRLAHGGVWHSPQSGIWQTVWLESVPHQYIRSVAITPLYDESAVQLLVDTEGSLLPGNIQIYARGTLVATGDFQSGQPARIRLPGAISWSPDRPFLYTVKITMGDDAVGSYFGMRKISVELGRDGRRRIWLNNKPFFTTGVLDQGLYSDGGLTPPSDAAMISDLQFAIACGFNTIRKHGKMEPLRWYYHCDRLGMLVWQDLPAGGDEPRHSFWERRFGQKARRDDTQYTLFGRQDETGRTAFTEMAHQMAATLHNCPCLVTWVLFQDGQGQFDANTLAKLMHQWDPTRLIDHASGRFDQGGGDIQSIHLYQYEKPPRPQDFPLADARAMLVTETGGMGLVPNGHFCGTQAQAAKLFASKQTFGEAITTLYRDFLSPYLAQGACGYFYAQLSDAEDEVSGMLSCDRRLQKINPKGMASLNKLAREAANTKG